MRVLLLHQGIQLCVVVDVRPVKHAMQGQVRGRVVCERELVGVPLNGRGGGDRVEAPDEWRGKDNHLKGWLFAVRAWPDDVSQLVGLGWGLVGKVVYSHVLSKGLLQLLQLLQLVLLPSAPLIAIAHALQHLDLARNCMAEGALSGPQLLIGGVGVWAQVQLDVRCLLHCPGGRRGRDN